VFKRTVLALFRKQFSIKFRSFAALFELFVALTFYFILYPIDTITISHYRETRSPPVSHTELVSLDILKFFLWSNQSRFAVMPSNNQTAALAKQFAQFHLSMTSIVPEFATSVDDLRARTSGTEYNGLGIWWRNSDQPSAFSSPEFEIYCQTLDDCPDTAVLRWLRQYVAVLAWQSTPSDPKAQSLAALNSSSQRFPRLSGTNQYDLQYVYSFITVVPIVVSSMPDFSAILDEKDSRVAAFAFLNGCPEAAYWIVMFVTPFVFSVIPYIVMCVMYCYWFRMVGNDISLMLFLSFLFIAAHILFQMWVSTMMKVGSHGRSFTIVIVVFELFFAFVHKFVTLDSPDTNAALKHIFGIIPFSCFEMIIGSYYYNGVQNRIRLTWNNMDAPELHYQLWIGMTWLFVDIVFYLLLFLLCNACNARSFGTAPLRWSELFSRSAWRRLWGGSAACRIGSYTCDFIRVWHLKKSYGDVVVYQDANFYVNEGEVIAIIGPNGAGKTTLVNILAGAIDPDGGVLEFRGVRSKRFAVIRGTLGIVFQENVLFERLSVREHLRLFGAFKGISEANLGDAIEFFTESLGLTHMLDTYAGDLSGGQKRKLCVAIGLLGNPPIVIMDEPTAGVDVQARQLIWKTIAMLPGTTSIITSHALEEAETVSLRLFIVADKRIPFCGTSTELRNEYQCGYLLRVDRDDGGVGEVLALAQQFVPASRLHEERRDTVRIPVDHMVPQLLKELGEKKEQLGINSFSFAVEQLEDMLLKMIETGQPLHRAAKEEEPSDELEVAHFDDDL
jgi:ABC-type multidrug transport system ATPase subunit